MLIGLLFIRFDFQLNMTGLTIYKTWIQVLNLSNGGIYRYLDISGIEIKKRIAK